MSELAALMVRRLCHDFAGPAGAVATTIEMLADGPDPELTALASESSAALVATLELYRFVLTPATEPGGGPGRRLLGQWLAARGGPGLDWPDDDAAWAAGIGPLTVGLAMVAAEAAPRGASLRVTEGRVLVPGTTLAADVAAALGGDGATTTRAALAAVLHGAALAAAMSITVDPGEAHLALALNVTRAPRFA